MPLWRITFHPHTYTINLKCIPMTLIFAFKNPMQYLCLIVRLIVFRHQSVIVRLMPFRSSPSKARTCKIVSSKTSLQRPRLLTSNSSCAQACFSLIASAPLAVSLRQIKHECTRLVICAVTSRYFAIDCELFMTQTPSDRCQP